MTLSSNDVDLSRAKLMRRALDGVLLLDKPLGLSSNQALGRAKYLFAAKKAGHTGTLDPLASGLLPLCFGEATKFSQDLLNATKRYQATLALGACTTTGDAEGEVLQTRPVTCDLASVQQALARLRGDILQVPPMYSALKRDGKPLYEYARAGLTLERAARPVTIYELRLISYVLPNGEELSSAKPELQIVVSCSKGTYIRVLAEEIGELLGCGAHLTALRRLGVGNLTLANAVSLDTLEAAKPAERMHWLQPADALLSTCPIVRLDSASTSRFKQGQRLKLPAELTLEASYLTVSDKPFSDAVADPLRVRVYGEASQFLGTANFSDGVLAPQRLIHS